MLLPVKFKLSNRATPARAVATIARTGHNVVILMLQLCSTAIFIDKTSIAGALLIFFYESLINLMLLCLGTSRADLSHVPLTTTAATRTFHFDHDHDHYGDEHNSKRQQPPAQTRHGKSIGGGLGILE